MASGGSTTAELLWKRENGKSGLSQITGFKSGCFKSCSVKRAAFFIPMTLVLQLTLNNEYLKKTFFNKCLKHKNSS
jgi:hypothetical protein